ncbi:MAG: K(+)-transporting ATPase subunit F [Chloroflexi bacterium]|nr:K(+)-transporting ATPase subunit F [Chloroflexota bacterium]
MNAIYIAVGIISLGLLVYLFIALIFPEKFG